MKRIPYYIRLSIIILILLSPIVAFQIGWYFFGKKDGLLFAFCYGIIAVSFACYKFYISNWRDED